MNFLISRFFPTLLACSSALVMVKPSGLRAQVPDVPMPAPQVPGGGPLAPQAPQGAFPQQQQQPKPSPFGNDVPKFDPGSEILMWDGKNWNVNNNRLFQARFEKYLAAPEATTEEDKAYQATIAEILQRLAPGTTNRENIQYAFRLLTRCSAFDQDARLCASLADAVYTVWQAQRNQSNLVAANEGLEKERARHEWNARLAGEGVERQKKMTNASSSKSGGGQQSTTEEITEVMTLTPYMSRLGETLAQIKANQVKRELSEIQAKIEYQGLLVQFFLQRRYQHVLMGTRFYRSLFSDGDVKLNLQKDAKDLFEKSTATPPTINSLDAMANEAVRDVRESVRAFTFLVEAKELESASKRLAEAFAIGEFMPEIRSLPREQKRKTLRFTQKANQLISAIDVKDYGLAEKVVKELTEMAEDFDSSKPMAAVETSRTVAQMHLAKARNAALSGDRATLEIELKAATEIWPRNPQLAEVSKLIFDQGDMQQRALTDFDQLLSQRNFRQIYEGKERFIAASALYPDRQKQLQNVMENMQLIEAAILRAEEMQRQSNSAGAWESVERAFMKFPEDSKLNQVRADLTTRAADFVRTLRTAQDLEKKEQIGSSLAWFLQALRLYPASEFAADAVNRLKAAILEGESAPSSGAVSQSAF